MICGDEMNYRVQIIAEVDVAAGNCDEAYIIAEEIVFNDL
jgi:hypothetical protein